MKTMILFFIVFFTNDFKIKKKYIYLLVREETEFSPFVQICCQTQIWPGFFLNL